MAKVLNRQEFERWEKLMLQRTLDSMEDIIYCPKCSNPIIVDENNTHAFCMICNLDFCKLCKDTWHPVVINFNIVLLFISKENFQ